MKRILRILLNIAIPFCGLLMAVFLGPGILHFFMPFVIGWILALLANPLVRFLEKRGRLVRRHGSILIIVLALAIVIGLIYGAGMLIYRELGRFLADIPDIYKSVIFEIEDALQNSRKLAEYFPENLRAPILTFSDNIDGLLGKMLSRAAEPTFEIAGSVAKSIPNIMVNTVIVILSSYLFLAERESIMKWLDEHLPGFVFRYIEYLKKDAKGMFGGYVLAQLRIMFIVAFILAVGFILLGVRHGILLALLTAVLDFLPIFGTGTVLCPWALVKLFAGEYTYAAGLVILYILTQVVRQLVQPKIVGDLMGVSPLMTLFMLYMGFKIKGLAGMILAVPVGLFFINFYKYGAFDSMIRNFKMLLEEIGRFRREE